MLEQANIILKTTGVDKLPSLPHVLLKLLTVLNQENGDFDQIAALIRQDPSLFTRFLFVSNLSNTGNTSYQPLEQTLPLIGIDTIKNIINISTVQQFFSPYSHEKVDFLKQHWQHSVLCAQLAKTIAQHTCYKNIDEAYIAGLTHDIGQLALENAYPKQYTSIFAQLSEDEYFYDLENDEFGTTHHQVSTLLLKRCGITHAISDAVLYHHEASSLILDAHPLVKIINLSNQLSNSDFKPEDTHIFDAANKLFGINKDDLMVLLQSAKNEVELLAKNLEINFKENGADGETSSKVDGDDELKQVQLAEQVRNIALFDGAQQPSNHSSNKYDAVKNIELKAGLLFNINNVVIFKYDENNNRVIALTSNPEPDFLEDLSIPIEAERSLITDAFINKAPLHSFDENIESTTVIDQQLAGLDDSEGMLCIPIKANDTISGVLVLGVSEEQQKQLWKQRSLLSRFANTITQSLNVDNKADTDAPDQLIQFENNNRKIAHEIRNPLSVINNYLEILSLKLDNENESQQSIDTIRSEITRIGGILEKLSSPTSSPETISSVNINSAIRDLTQIFLGSLAAEKSIQIKLELDENMPQIICDINAVKQVYTNLIKNAIEALPTNGHILVYTSGYVNVNGQEFIEISVTDNGPGITSTVLPELFSPVDTTKGDDHSGLGLSIVKDLVSDLNGTISCKSNTQGTSFHILLPKKL